MTLTLKKLIYCAATCVVLTAFVHARAAGAPPGESIHANPLPDAYNVVWNSPSTDRTGEMPVGNGDIAAGVYAIENDALYLLLSKNDALDDQGELLKTGRVKIELSPNPFAKGKPFKQTLDLKTGSIKMEADKVELLVWADANKPVYHVQITSPSLIKVKADVDTWKRMGKIDDALVRRGNHVISYYGVGDKSVYLETLKFYGIGNMADQHPDPYRFNTFGNLMSSPQLELKDGKLCGEGQNFDIRIYAQCEQIKDAEVWLKKLEAVASQSLDVARDWQAHCSWWSNFWDRSWIVINDNTIPENDKNQLDSEGYKIQREAKDKGALVAQNYNVFRYLMACQSRGRIQTKFNGGLFTQPQRVEPEKSRRSYKLRVSPKGEWIIPGKLYITHEDGRAWGRRFTFQNQRLLYWPLLMSGDEDLVKPFFDFYWNLLPLRVAVNRAWFGHDGAYFRENIDLCGGEMDCETDGNTEYAKPLKVAPGGNHGQGNHHSFYFTSGLETTAMMIERVKFSDDAKFRDEVLVPFAREILTFYDQHFQRDAKGKLLLDPSQALETWWVTVNPATDIAGLQHCLDELLLMGAGTAADKANWKRLRAEIPEIPMRIIEGKPAIAPAEKFSHKRNGENAELYPVFPFNRFGVGMGTEDLVEWTTENRTVKDGFGRCWNQDQIDWAYAGNAAEAKKGLIARFSITSPLARFPLYGFGWPDEIPDLDHFGSGSTALQRMLVQVVSPRNPGENGKIMLLPAWPADWDANFKLHVDHQTTIQGIVKNGQLINWSINPHSRAKDVVVGRIQK